MNGEAGTKPVPRLRRRLMLAFSGTVIVTTLALTLAAYLLVAVSLSRNSLDEALSQSRFNLLLAQTILPEEPTNADYERLFTALAIRGSFATLAVDGEASYQSSPQVSPSLVSGELSAALDPGRLTYQAVKLGGGDALAVGTRVRVDGPALYFFYPQTAPQLLLERLRTVLAATGLILAVLGLLLGWALARRLTRPLTAATTAAARVAAGDLTVRLPAGPDEFGVLGQSFNTMAATVAAKMAALEAAEARERRFTADVAHELRTPLAALVGESSLLEKHLARPDAAALPADTRRAAHLLVRDVDRLRRLVDDLLEISRIDAHSADVQWEPIDLFDFLARMGAARRWPAEVIVADDRASAPPADRIHFTTDRRRFERIVGNLVENALAHGAPPVVVAAQVVGRDDADPHLVLSVTDQGPGIPPEHLPHVFDRFYKADPSRRDRRTRADPSGPGGGEAAMRGPSGGSGTGLGLSIAWENARLLGGTLHVTSSPGEGTRFTLRLPLPHSDLIVT